MFWDAVSSILAKPADILPRSLSHQKKDSLLGQDIVECCSKGHKSEWEILVACHGFAKLLTIAAIYIKKPRPQLNRHNEYPGWELILKS